MISVNEKSVQKVAFLFTQNLHTYCDVALLTVKLFRIRSATHNNMYINKILYFA